MSQKSKGISLMLISALCFSTMNLLIPMATGIPTFQKAFFRNAIACIIAFILFKRQQKTMKTHITLFSKPLVLRSLLGTLGVLCNYYALDNIYIADASVLAKIAPFATLVFSAVFLKESFKPYHVIAIGLAFLGMLFIARPTFHIATVFPYAIACLGGLFAGGAYTCLRYLNQQRVNPSFIVAYFSAFSCLSILPKVIETATPMTITQTLLLIGAGLAAAGGQFAITYAYKFAAAQDISIFDYSTILFTGLFGWVILTQIPDLWSLIGYALIFSGALLSYLFNRT